MACILEGPQIPENFPYLPLLLLPFPNSFGWWWLISSVFLIMITCHKTIHANGYYGAWPGWAVSVSVLPLTISSDNFYN